jgi:hypothetical protein
MNLAYEERPPPLIIREAPNVSVWKTQHAIIKSKAKALEDFLFLNVQINKTTFKIQNQGAIK